MAIVANGAICRSRLVKLRSVKKVSSSVPNTMAMTTSPTTMGSEPSSPARTFCHQRRT